MFLSLSQSKRLPPSLTQLLVVNAILPCVFFHLCYFKATKHEMKWSLAFLKLTHHAITQCAKSNKIFSITNMKAYILKWRHTNIKFSGGSKHASILCLYPSFLWLPTSLGILWFISAVIPVSDFVIFLYQCLSHHVSPLFMSKNTPIILFKPQSRMVYS